MNGSGSGWESGNWGQRVKCESQSGSFGICNVPTYGYVRLVRQLSQSPCVAGRTWGYQRDQIWVGNGCRAEFEMGYGDCNWQGDKRVVSCQSNDGRYSRCFARTEGRCHLRRQLSSTLRAAADLGIRPERCLGGQRLPGRVRGGSWRPGVGLGRLPGHLARCPGDPGNPGGGNNGGERSRAQACSSETGAARTRT